MRLAIREAAAHRRPDAGSGLRVDRVEIEADVEEGRAGSVRDRFAHAALDADAVDVGHREDLRVDLLQQLPLALIERTYAEERQSARLDRRERPAFARERVAAEPERRREHHSVDVAAR